MNRTMIKNNTAGFLNILVPLLLALLVGACFIMIAGYNPLEVYLLIAKTAFTSDGWMQTLGFSCPIILTGIATAFAFQSGLWNIGVEGQLYCGAFAAALVGAGYFGLDAIPAFLQMPAALLAGILMGTIYAMIPALLKAYLNVDVVVTTIMLNYIAIEFTEFLTKVFFQGDSTYDATYAVSEAAEIPKIISRYRVTYAIFLAVLVVAIVWFISRKTSFGYEISAIGRQLEFSEATGMRVRKKIIIIFMISGAIAGIAGATEVLGVNKNFTPNFSTNPGFGWQGYYTAVLAHNNPLGVLIIAILFGGFRYGTIAAQSSLGIPLDLVNIIQGTLILFYAIKYISSRSRFLEKIFSWIPEKTAKTAKEGGK